jgi:DNA-binding transcriptional ArsR family regulator
MSDHSVMRLDILDLLGIVDRCFGMGWLTKSELCAVFHDVPKRRVRKDLRRLYKHGLVYKYETKNKDGSAFVAYGVAQ